MDEFYITLLSDASYKLYHSNTAGKFTNKLSTRLHLSDEWEVALLEIHVPTLFYNMYNSRSRAWLVAQSKILKRCVFQTDHVVEPSVVIEKLQKDLGTIFTFTVNEGRFQALCEDDVRTYNLRFTKPLALQLGFVVGSVFAGPKIRAPAPMNFNVGLPTLGFVHCDIIKPQYIGERMCQVLRCITLNDTNYIHGGVKKICVACPQYVALNVHELEHISIDIKDRDGIPLPFIDGTTSVLLHFRKRSAQQ